ncbi:MAG: Transcriptional regulator, LysR family [Labilithrix sp.]|nr:Transcriptional regulator, LysR family [Labilithrix sp.]
MDLRELGYFVAVYEERSVSAAARRCFISQPSVSAALANLEHELGTKLFVRHRRGVVPTDAGERLHPLARRLADEASAVRALFRAPTSRPRLKLGLMPSLDIARTLAIVAPLVSDARADLKLVDADSPCDVRIVSESMKKKGETFVPLWSEKYVVALPPGHPLALKPALRKRDLVGAKVVERCHCEYGPRFTEAARSGRRLEVAAVAASEEWAVALVSAGLGIAFLPEGVVRQSDHVTVRPLVDVHASREVGLAYDDAAELAPGVVELVAAVRSRAATTDASTRMSARPLGLRTAAPPVRSSGPEPPAGASGARRSEPSTPPDDRGAPRRARRRGRARSHGGQR